MSQAELVAARPGLALGKYWKIFQVSLIERLTYRGDFFLSTVLRFLPLATTLLLWHAVYGDPPRPELGGFTLDEMVAYLLLVQISRLFSSMPGLASGLARDVRTGTLNRYLLQPLDLMAYLFAYRGAHKIAVICTSAPAYALLFFLCRSYFHGLPDLLTLAAWLTALLLGFLVGFLFEAAIGMLGFWFLEVSSLLYVVNTINFFVSGHMFPLDLLPPFWAGLLKMLPFQYLAYFPAAVFLGKISGPELVQGLLTEAAWVVFFFALSRGLFRWGLRRYSAFGG
jgi:ABC-2 type transport system permease protein